MAVGKDKTGVLVNMNKEMKELKAKFKLKGKE